jgi:hypothetical protein
MATSKQSTAFKPHSEVCDFMHRFKTNATGVRVVMTTFGPKSDRVRPAPQIVVEHGKQFVVVDCETGATAHSDNLDAVIDPAKRRQPDICKATMVCCHRANAIVSIVDP